MLPPPLTLSDMQVCIRRFIMSHAVFDILVLFSINNQTELIAFLSNNNLFQRRNKGNHRNHIDKVYNAVDDYSYVEIAAALYPVNQWQ